MTWSDPIVDEVRRIRAAYAARFNYDLRAIYRDLKEQEKRSGCKVVPCQSESEPSKALQSNGPAPAVSEKIPT
jgi:predicted GNAT superfamily acetyltransferase